MSFKSFLIEAKSPKRFVKSFDGDAFYFSGKRSKSYGNQPVPTIIIYKNKIGLWDYSEITFSKLSKAFPRDDFVFGQGFERWGIELRKEILSKKYSTFVKTDMNDQMLFSVLKARTNVPVEFVKKSFKIDPSNFVDLGMNDNPDDDMVSIINDWKIYYMNPKQKTTFEDSLRNLLDRVDKTMQSRGLKTYSGGELRIVPKIKTERTNAKYYISDNYIQLLLRKGIDFDELYYTMIHELGHKVYHTSSNSTKMKKFSQVAHREAVKMNSDDKIVVLNDKEISLNRTLITSKTIEKNKHWLHKVTPKQKALNKYFKDAKDAMFWYVLNVGRDFEKDVIKIAAETESENFSGYLTFEMSHTLFLDSFNGTEFIKYSDTPNNKNILKWSYRDYVKSNTNRCFVPSKYGLTNSSEWWAEMFGLWVHKRMGKCELRNYMDGLIK